MFEDHGRPLAASVQGGQLLSPVEAAIDQMPVFVRAGAIVPLRSRDEQYVGEFAENPLAIAVYPGPNQQYLLYQDDGISTWAETKRAFRTTRINRSRIPGGTNVRLERLHDGYTPAEAYLLIRLLGAARPATVAVNEVRLSAAASVAALDDAPADAYVWDEGQAVVTVKVFTHSADLSVTVLCASPMPR